jgi:hypothetical protein
VSGICPTNITRVLNTGQVKYRFMPRDWAFSGEQHNRANPYQVENTSDLAFSYDKIVIDVERPVRRRHSVVDLSFPEKVIRAV